MATGKIVFWKADGGWGKVLLEDGKEWFVHYSALSPEPRRGADFTGTELVEVVTGQGKKGTAVTSAKIPDQELLRQSPVLHTFKNVEIRGIRFEGGKAVIQSVDSESRWTGEALTVYDRRKHPADTATVTVRGSSKQEFGRTTEVVTAVVLESSPDQEAEPEFVLDVLAYSSNTKNRVRSADLSKVAWNWSSVSGHANIHDYTILVVVPFGVEIADKYSGKAFGSYAREVFQSFEASCVGLLSSKEDGNTTHNWVRADGQNAWVAWNWNGGNRKRVEIIPNQSGKSGKIVFVRDDDTWKRRKTFEYEFKRLSHFVYLMLNRLGKEVLGGKEEELPKSAFDPETELLTSKEAELTAAGYTVYHSGSSTGSIYHGLQKGELVFRGWDIRPVVYGFIPDMDAEQAKVFSKAIEILAGGKKLVASLKAGEIKQPVAEEEQAQQAPVKAEEILYGTMPASTFGSRQNEGWALRLGLEEVSVPSGRAVKLGPKGGGWRIERIESVAVSPALSGELTKVAIAKTNGKFVLVKAEKVETGKFLVRVNTAGLRKLGRTAASVFRGSPTLITEGWMEIGSQNVSHHRDQLWVVSDGDVLRVGQEYRETAPDRVIYVEGGELRLDSFHAWRVRDARANPAEYIANGWCPVDRLPKEWIGRVVEFFDEARETLGAGNPYGLTKVGLEPEVNYEWNALKPSGYNPLQNVRPEAVWAKLRDDLVWDQTPKAKILDEHDVVEFSDPPYPDGTQVVATIKQAMVHHEAVWGRAAYDSKETKVVIPNTPGEKFHVTKYEKGGLTEEIKESRGEVRVDYVMPEYPTSKVEKLPEGFPEFLDGEYVVEFVEPRKRPWYWRVVREAPKTTGPTMDYEVFTRKNVTQHVWVIDVAGAVTAEKTTDKPARFTGIPVASLILKHVWHGYGYAYNEIWEVYYRPEKVTEAQAAKAKEIAAQEPYYHFTGAGTGFDPQLRLGKVYFYMSNRHFTNDQMRALRESFPLKADEFLQEQVKADRELEEADHPTVKMVEVIGPEKK